MFYKDINTYSPQTKPDVIDAEAIKQSVKNLIFTRPGERLFNIDYGINSEGLLFELMYENTASELLNELSEKISAYEPRVSFNLGLSSVNADYDSNSLSINLHFEIEGFEGKLFEVTETLK